MKLTVNEMHVEHLFFGKDTALKGNELMIDRQALMELLVQDERIAAVDLEIAQPGESTRILPVKDVIEPRAKMDGGGFPGVIGAMDDVGEGVTVALKHCAVVTTGPIVGFQEGLIDMSGPAAAYSPFAALNLLVVHITKRNGVDPHQHEAAVREAGVKAAHFLAAACLHNRPHHQETLEWKSLPEKLQLNAEATSLPRVMVVYPCMSQGLLHDTYLYGLDTKKIIPTFLSPLDVLDSAFISGNCVSPGSKTTTWHHQNHAVIRECLRRDGKELHFLGVVVTPLKITLEEKVRNTALTVKIVRMMGAQGVVQCQEGFGNPTTDLMMICHELEKQGIKTVLISNEDAGTDGMSESLPDSTPEADAMVSTGNSNATIQLPPMGRVLGDFSAIERITGGFHGSIQEDGGLMIEIHGIMGSHNLQGASRLSAVTR